jgi:hypothetical protein
MRVAYPLHPAADTSGILDGQILAVRWASSAAGCLTANHLIYGSRDQRGFARCRAVAIRSCSLGVVLAALMARSLMISITGTFNMYFWWALY